MANPSWLPSWPSNWPDYPGIFADVVPREWPKMLWRRGGNAYLDNQALGESVALVRQLMRWMTDTVLPHQDDEAQFLERWEAAFSLPRASTLGERQDNLVSAWRYRSTVTQDVVKAVFCNCWGFKADPSVVTVVAGDIADIAVEATLGAKSFAFAHNHLHIYHTAQTAHPDYTQADTLIAKMQPMWATWTIGRYKYAPKWSTADLTWKRRWLFQHGSR